MSLSYLSGSILYQFEDVVTVYCSEIFDKDILSVFVCVCVCVRAVVPSPSRRKSHIAQSLSVLAIRQEEDWVGRGRQQPPGPSGHLSSHRFSYSQMSAITAPHTLTHKSASPRLSHL